MTSQIIAHEMNQFQVRFPACCIERHQSVNHFAWRENLGSHTFPPLQQSAQDNGRPCNGPSIGLREWETTRIGTLDLRPRRRYFLLLVLFPILIAI